MTTDREAELILEVHNLEAQLEEARDQLRRWRLSSKEAEEGQNKRATVGTVEKLYSTHA